MTADVPARIAIVDSDQWPRASLRAELIERGYDAVGYLTVRDAMTALARSGRPRLVVVDLHGQLADQSALAALFALGVPVVAIAGAAEAAEEPRLGHPWAAFLRRPLTLGAVVEVVEKQLRGEASPSSRT